MIMKSIEKLQNEIVEADRSRSNLTNDIAVFYSILQNPDIVSAIEKFDAMRVRLLAVSARAETLHDVLSILHERRSQLSRASDTAEFRGDHEEYSNERRKLLKLAILCEIKSSVPSI